MKIPTLLGLGLLLIAIGLGIFLYYANQGITQSATAEIVNPKNIQVVNITDTSATVIWETDTPSTGLISWGDTQDLGNSQNDIRDTSSPLPHLTHFVTLNGLNPRTTYFFKVRSNLSFFPDKDLQFKTASPDTSQDKFSNKAIFGVILDTNLQPIDEALVVLKSSQTADLATVTTSAGNFLLPLVNLRTKDLSQNFLISDKLPAQLLIYSKRGTDTSSFTLPLDDKPFPKIILGQDNDFTQLTATFSAQLTTNSEGQASPSAQVSNPFDINKDGAVNTYDLSILMQSFGKKAGDPGFNKAADLNGDGVVNQFDLSILKKALR